jgi:hypothetical protein
MLCGQSPHRIVDIGLVVVVSLSVGVVVVGQSAAAAPGGSSGGGVRAGAH